MMNVKKKLLGIGLVAMMSLSITTGVFAETKTNDVDITVQAGEFSVTTSNIDSFGSITLDATPQTHKTSFESVFTVKDLRGSQDGWRLDVEASQFTSGSDTLPKGSLSLEPISDISRVGTGTGNAPTESTSTNVIIDNGKVEIAKAGVGSGMGVFELTFPNNSLSLVVDATTAKVGMYQSTLTWTLVTAP